jgi:ferritin-like metal-binding protein YciE
MSIETLEDLFVHELSDIYSAERQLTKALPKLAKACANEELKAAFENHLKETEGQIERLDQVFKICGVKLKRRKCEAMEGLITEGQNIIKEMEEGPLRDLALISAAQKVEHYEISGYLSLMKIAKEMDSREAFFLLDETLAEEENTDEKLSFICDEELELQSEEDEETEEGEDEEGEEEEEEDTGEESEESGKSAKSQRSQKAQKSQKSQKSQRSQRSQRSQKAQAA